MFLGLRLVLDQPGADDRVLEFSAENRAGRPVARIAVPGLKLSPADLNGEQGLALAAEEASQVMVLDLRMPGHERPGALRAVKSRWPFTEVIMLTGHGSEQDRDACLALGAGAYHKKPLDQEMPLDSIRAAARRHEERQGPSGRRV